MDYWDQVEDGLQEEEEDYAKTKEERRQQRIRNCGTIRTNKDPQTGKLSKTTFVCRQIECPGCLDYLAQKEKDYLEKAMVDFGTIQTLTVDSKDASTFVRKLGRAGITKDMRRRLPQDDGTTVFFFVNTTGNGKFASEDITIDNLGGFDWTELARRPAGVRTSGALGAPPRVDNKDDRAVLKIKAVSSNGSEDQEDKAEEIANNAIVGVEPDANNVEALCNMWAAEYETALRQMGCVTTSAWTWVRCDLNAICWKDNVANNQPQGHAETSNEDHWLFAYSEI